MSLFRTNVLMIAILLILLYLYVSCGYDSHNTTSISRLYGYQLDSSKEYFVLWLCGTFKYEGPMLLELFPTPQFRHVEHSDYLLANSTYADNIRRNVKAIVYNVENAGQDGNYDIVTNYTNSFRIPILVHLSDEFQGATGRKWKYGAGVRMVYEHAVCVLRQYSIIPYIVQKNAWPQVIQMPLPYHPHMLRMNETSHQIITSSNVILYANPTLKRNVSWSFFGEVRGRKDRKATIDVFSVWEPFINDWGKSPIEMRNAYNISKFVIVGRGQSSLDCFRLYEAMIAGGIAIVIGEESEIVRTFSFEGDVPPLFSASTPEMALSLARNMTDDEIDLRRELQTAWYIRRMDYIRKKIRYFLNVF